MLKMKENPPMLSGDVESIGVLSGTWWIAHTRARFEKAFAWDLAAARVPYFLPMVERVTFSGGRKRRNMTPLFSSYVFFCGDDEARQAALRTDRLARVIPVPDQPQLVAELLTVEQALAGRAELDLYPFAAVGQRCRVKAGPFMGLVGTVVERKEKARLVLQVSMLGQGAALEVDLDLLEPTDDETSGRVAILKRR